MQEASLQQFLMKYLQREAHLRIGDAFTAAFWLQQQQQAGTDARPGARLLQLNQPAGGATYTNGT